MLKLRVLVAEFIGTFALVFVGCLVLVNMAGQAESRLIGAALAYGFVVATMVWATSAISGGHLNPAVSFGLFVARRIDGITALGYIISQVMGGLAGASLFSIIQPGEVNPALLAATPALGTNVLPWAAVVAEAVATFFLLFVIFSTSLDRRQNRQAALFIGLIFVVCMFAIGPLTGAALNPARYFGPAMVMGKLDNWYVYVVGPLLGAFGAALLFSTKAFQPEEFFEMDHDIVNVEHVPAELHHPQTPELAQPAAPLVHAEPVVSAEPPARTMFAQNEPQPSYLPSHVGPSFTEPGVAPDGRTNFSSIYRMANLPDVAFTVEQALEMLASLPKDLPMESKRTAINVTLQTMAKATGASPETVLADAARKIQALGSFAETYTEQANQYILKTQHEIETMEADIERRQRGTEDATQKQTQMVEACQVEAERLEKVFEFFEESVRSRFSGPGV